MRRAARVDDNQREVMAALRQVGASVEPTHAVGAGFPDIVVGFRGANYLLEIKDGNKRPSERRLTPHQQKWHATWQGNVCVVTNSNEALEAIGVRSKQSVPEEPTSKHWSEETNWKPLSDAVAVLKRQVEDHHYNCRSQEAQDAHDDLVSAEWRLRQAERRRGK